MPHKMILTQKLVLVQHMIDDPKFVWMQSPDNPKIMKIMRGVPASGKSYRAKEIAREHDENEDIIFSADLFFGKTTEEYVKNWAKERLFKAHEWCQNSARGALQKQVPLVIVDNTNTRVAEMMPYFAMAYRYDYKVEVEEPTSPWWAEIVPCLRNKVLFKKNIEFFASLLTEKNKESHCVPYDAILKMLMRFQPDVDFKTLAEKFKPRVF